MLCCSLLLIPELKNSRGLFAHATHVSMRISVALGSACCLLLLIFIFFLQTHPHKKKLNDEQCELYTRKQTQGYYHRGTCHEEVLSLQPMKQQRFQIRSGKYRHVLNKYDMVTSHYGLVVKRKCTSLPDIYTVDPMLLPSGNPFKCH